MNFVKTGKRYNMFNDSAELKQRLPVGFYELHATVDEGFFLQEHAPLVTEERLYGERIKDVDHVLKAFRELQDRNLGILLAGKKGLGKTVFAKQLANKAIAAGYPVILVNKNYSGITYFLERLQEEVVVLFDEFEKTFRSPKEQEELLSLLDGTSTGKKLYILTCNDVNDISHFIIDRPGRCHYRLSFGTPSIEEIEAYMREQIPAKRISEIKSIALYASAINASYDTLHAIAFELRLFDGPWYELVQRLNISKSIAGPDQYISYVLVMEDGSSYEGTNLFNSSYNVHNVSVSREIDGRKETIDLSYHVKNMEYDPEKQVFKVPGDKFRKITSTAPDGKAQIPKPQMLFLYIEDDEEKDDIEEDRDDGWSNIPDEIEEMLPFA